MQVFDDEDDRLLEGRELDRRAPCREELRAIDELDFGGTDGGGQQVRGSIGCFVACRGQPGPSGGADDLRRRLLRQVEQLEQERTQRPVRESLAVRKTLRGRDARIRTPGRQTIEELLEESALPDTGRGDHAHEERPPLVEGARRDELQLGEVCVASDQRRSSRSRGLGAPDHFTGGNRERFAPHSDRFDLAQLEATAGGSSGSLPHEDRPWLGCLLESGCDIHRVARDQEIAGGGLAACDDLAAADAQSDRQALAECAVFPDPIPELECCSHGPRGIVTMRHGQPEDGHDRVADELLERSSVGLDDLRGDGEIAGH